MESVVAPTPFSSWLGALKSLRDQLKSTIMLFGMHLPQPCLTAGSHSDPAIPSLRFPDLPEDMYRLIDDLKLSDHDTDKVIGRCKHACSEMQKAQRANFEDACQKMFACADPLKYDIWVEALRNVFEAHYVNAAIPMMRTTIIDVGEKIEAESTPLDMELENEDFRCLAKL